MNHQKGGKTVYHSIDGSYPGNEPLVKDQNNT
jgi:hypothetical protein